MEFKCSLNCTDCCLSPPAPPIEMVGSISPASLAPMRKSNSIHSVATFYNGEPFKLSASKRGAVAEEFCTLCVSHLARTKMEAHACWPKNGERRNRARELWQASELSACKQFVPARLIVAAGRLLSICDEHNWQAV